MKIIDSNFEKGYNEKENEGEKSAERYDGILGYDTPFGAHKLDLIAERVFEISGMDSTKNVLEIGSGTGELGIRYAKRAKEVVCTDINEYMVNLIKRKTDKLQIKNMKFAVAGAENIPFNENAFDIVIERNVQSIYQKRFLDDGTAQNVLCEMKRVSNNKVIIIHNNISHRLCPKKDPTAHYFSGKELKRMLETIGMKDVKVYYVGHSIPLLFNLFGVNFKKIEKIAYTIPYIKELGGSVIACGSK